MENYICINGKKAELTEEQMKALGIELPKESPFKRVGYNRNYYFIDGYGDVRTEKDFDYTSDEQRFDVANYCTNKEIMKQRALHETLNRLLWRYAMEHGGAGNFEIAWNGGKFIPQNCIWKYNGETFSTNKVAEDAINEIIKPFMEAHPDFKW